MQRWLLGTAVALAMAGPAIAADMPVKAPPLVKAPPAPIGYNWTGCYVDGGGGYGLFNEDSTTRNAGGPLTAKVTNGGRGWFGTAGAGCDVQFGQNLVFGAFGDYDFSGLRGNDAVPGTGLVGREKENSAWAAGARLGYALAPAILAYVNGGYTQARFGAVNLLSENLPSTPANEHIAAHNYSGWFLGSGFEYNLGWMPGLFWRTEYRYAQYGRDNLPILTNAGAPTGTTLASDKAVQTIRSELVWRFNWGGRY
jgi:outer membrane immunogenic protein